MENYLVHYGILGMKWGIRRYQNPDGTLTAEGRRRRGLKTAGNIAKGAAAVGAAAYAGKKGLDELMYRTYAKARGLSTSKSGSDSTFDKKENIARASSLNKGREAVGSIRQSRRDQKRADAQQRALDEARNMTDEQLKKRTSRLNLENNYVSAISQQQVNVGSDAVDSILAYTGTVLGLGATALTIYGLLHK